MDAIKPIFRQILATTIDDGWFKALCMVINEGKTYRISSGSFPGTLRRFSRLIVEMHIPDQEQLAPYIPEGSNIDPPTTEEKIQAYMKYLLTPEKQPNEHYTYGEDLWWEVEEVIKYYNKYGHENACCHMVVGRPESILFYNQDLDYNEDIIVKDRRTGKIIISRHLTNEWNKNPLNEMSSQCLRGIDTWIENNKLHFACYFRSQDLWAGFPENYGGIQLVKKYMAGCIGVEDGPLVAISRDLHVYQYAFVYALMRLRKIKDDIDLEKI